jgi:hypothetical protein
VMVIHDVNDIASSSSHHPASVRDCTTTSTYSMMVHTTAAPSLTVCATQTMMCDR